MFRTARTARTGVRFVRPGSLTWRVRTSCRGVTGFPSASSLLSLLFSVSMLTISFFPSFFEFPPPPFPLLLSLPSSLSSLQHGRHHRYDGFGVRRGRVRPPFLFFSLFSPCCSPSLVPPTDLFLSSQPIIVVLKQYGRRLTLAEVFVDSACSSFFLSRLFHVQYLSCSAATREGSTALELLI